MRRNPPETWYHVAYVGNLESILEHGLRPGRGRAMGVGGNRARSAGRLFLTAWEGVGFWMTRAEEHAEANADSPYSEGLTPVTLRFIVDGLPYEKDDGGSDDAGAPAVSTRETIPADVIDVWDGEEWIPLDDYGSIDASQAYTFEEDQDDPDVTLEYFKGSSPLEPTEP